MKQRKKAVDTVPKVPTGIPGLDDLAQGGLTKGRITLVSGTAGCGKTIFAAQFLAGGAHTGEPGVFVTFEEEPENIRANMHGLGLDVAALEKKGLWAFVDASAGRGETTVVGRYHLGALLARIEHAVASIGARRVAMDSLGAIFTQFSDPAIVRSAIMRCRSTLHGLGVTSVFTAERDADQGPVSRYGVEEFVADNIVVLRNARFDEKRRRTVEVLKLRGAPHHRGEYPFSILEGRGMVVVPVPAFTLRQKLTTKRMTSGNAGLDAMLGGGLFRDNVVLLTGPTGTGKSMLISAFIAGGGGARERSLLFAFEESREQVLRNALGQSKRLLALEKKGLVRIISAYPEAMSLEDRLLAVLGEIEDFRPQRVALDSLSSLQRISTEKPFREFVIGLNSYVKEHGICTIYTSATAGIAGRSQGDYAMWTLLDVIITLRHVELFGRMHRAIAVLKMRGSAHDTDIREFTIGKAGITIRKPIPAATGVLAGAPQPLDARELESLRELLQR